MKRKGTHDWWPDPVEVPLEARTHRELAKMQRFSVSYETGRMSFLDPPLQPLPMPKPKHKLHVQPEFPAKPGDRIDLNGAEFIVTGMMHCHDEIQLEVEPVPAVPKTPALEVDYEELEARTAALLGLGLGENDGWKTEGEGDPEA